jgi:uncharacterized integral membrane protein
MSSGEPPSDRAESAPSSTEDQADTAARAEALGESRGARFARKAHRARLYFYAGTAVVVVVFLVALVLANTGRVKVSWVFGASSVSLVWLVLAAAILGLVLGMALGALFHWRTRRPHD